MANPFYQPDIPRPAVRFTRKVGALRFAGRMIPRLLRFARALCVPGRRNRSTPDTPGRNVLWAAKCNALHRALADHDLTIGQARAILVHLSAGSACGCELVRLEPPTGVDARVLDRAVPLLGLQNFITVREQEAWGSSDPVLWVSVTEHGSRYAAEASARALAAAGASAEAAPEAGA